MKNKLLKAGYRRFNQPDGEPTLYQKKICDGKGIKYFINCYHYHFPERRDYPNWEFKIQVENEFGDFNITLFNTERITIKNMETIMECEWINHGAKYYEEYEKSENLNNIEDKNEM